MIIRYIRTRQNAKVPQKMHPQDACYDLYAPEDFTVNAHSTHTAMLGIVMEIPNGFAGIIKGRSGLTKKGVIVPTGTVDSNYRGEIGVTLLNVTDNPYNVKQGDRIAQFCIVPTYSLYFTEATTPLSETDRGAGGFGSTDGVTDAEK